MKRTYKVSGYRYDMRDKKQVDHLLILLRLKWEYKERAFKNKKLIAGYVYKKEYLKILRELKKFGITIKER